MTIFQPSVLKNHLILQDKDQVEKAYKKFSKYFDNVEIQNNIKDSKEEQFQEGFLRELFVNILGYTLNPQPKFNLTTEFKNLKGAKKADGAILKEGKAIVVIELKGSKTKDLESIRQQAFDYKSHHPDCVYVVTSNFEKLRFYINDSLTFEEFDLFNLKFIEFELLYLCLFQTNVFNNTPLKIKEESVAEEETITKKFYSDYSLFKRELYRDLVRKNMSNGVFRNVLTTLETERADKNIKLLLFKKSQKLIDRFLFIFFAEDRGLLSPNSTIKIIDQWNKLKQLDEVVPLYDRYKKYFNYLDTGRKGSSENTEIFAYNGGLFKPDEVLDSLLIDDELLAIHTAKLANYDFDSQVDVNILGHIFENSLNEIESVNAEIEGTDFDKQKTKRKKDGVFYTPKYITKYIVDNTIGKLCVNKKNALEIFENEYFKSRKGRTKIKLEELSGKLENYRNWLLQITICDPACGSGAFLNQALDFLIKEHQYIDELQTRLLGGGFVFPDIENTVLEKNIFGVDLNEESVEIAKLSLWLRTAQPRRKLNDLNSNIKCGNSLIDIKALGADRSFKWENEFASVFSNGGFDVIIGNPPYVGEKGHSEIFEALKQIPKWKAFYRRRSNTYYFFIKLGLDLLKDQGIQSLIVPREFTNADWANKVRKAVLDESQILEIVDFNDTKVFADAGTTSLILTHQKSGIEQYHFQFVEIGSQMAVQNAIFDTENRRTISVSSLKSEEDKPWDFNSFKIEFDDNIVPLSHAFNVSQGLVTGSDKVTKKHIISGLVSEKMLGRGVFILNEGIDISFNSTDTLLNIDSNWVILNTEDKKLIKPYFRPEHLDKWSIFPTDQYIIYVGREKMTSNIKSYLLQFEKILLNRSTIVETVISLDEFLNYTTEDIKSMYSPAGAVQKIMRKKQWFLPLYERANVPFGSDKIVVNTKNMDVFTLSSNDLYSSGGGAGGQNYIYPKLNCKFFEQIKEYSNVSDFVAYVNAVLNSSVITFIIKKGQYNQLSTAKISDLPIRMLDFSNKNEREIFNKITSSISQLKNFVADLNRFVLSFNQYLAASFNFDSRIFFYWNEMNFKEFMNELNKAIKTEDKEKLNKSEEMEWMELFEKKKAETVEIKNRMDVIEKELDQMVCELYGLTDDQIALIKKY